MNRSLLEQTGLAVLAALCFLLPLLHLSFVSEPFSLIKEAALVAAALLLLLIAGLSRLRGRRGLRPGRGVALAALATLAAATVAALRSTNRGLALPHLAILASLGVLAWGTARFATRPRRAVVLFRCILASAVAVSLGSLAQIFEPGFGLSLAGTSLLPSAPGGATLGDPGLAAQFLLIAIPCGLAAAALSRGPGRLLAGAGLGLVIASLVYAGRPEAWTASFLVACAIVLTRVIRALRAGAGWTDLTPDLAGSSLRAVLVAGTVVLIVFALARTPGLADPQSPVEPLSHVGLLAPTTGDPAVDRAAAVRGTAALLTLHPLGVGPGYWRHAFLEVAWTRLPHSPFSLSHQAVHVGDSWIEMAAEIGLPGGILFALLYAALLAAAGRAALRDGGDWGEIGFGALNTLLAAGVVALYGSPFQEATPALAIAVAAGLALAARAGAAAPAETPQGDRAVGRPRRRWIAFALLGVLWIGAAGLASFWTLRRVESARRTLAGQALLSAGKPVEAMAALSGPAVLEDPDHLPSALRGDAALRARRYEAAIGAFGITLRRSPWFLAAHLGRAAAWEALGRYDRADDDLEAALAIWPDNPETLLRRAGLNDRRGRPERAIADYERVTALDATLADPWFAIGQIQARLGRYADAIASYRTCLEKNPRHPRVNLALGDAFQAKGLTEMAVRFYQRAAALDEKAVGPRLKLANAFHLTGKDCEARDSLLAARDLETDPDRRAIILGLIDKVDAGCRKEKAAR